MTIVMPTNAMTMRVAPMIVHFFFLLLNILYQFFVLLAKFLNRSRITLSQVLLVLFTITDNHDLLNLHARQQNPRYIGESHSSKSGWLKCLARALQEKLEEDNIKLFRHYKKNQLSEKEEVDSITQKLDGLAKLLNLYPYGSDGQFQGKLKAVSYKSIKALFVPIQIHVKLLAVILDL